ncbi:MAG: hypothetical protein KatS3mg115_1066 [Candidatus Poribacteria bacterium]|nr:MAG: hypothetical protein KatS3mg115_1066 [Candidatus Poribacteria bacterium]
MHTPTDATGVVDEWPDPLPPVRGPFEAAGGRNHPIWILIRVPEEAPAGDYVGTVTVQAGEEKHRVPIRLHVWDFTLPEETHVQSAFGFSAGNVRRYHRLEDEATLQEVLDRLLSKLSGASDLAVLPAGADSRRVPPS